MSRCFLEPVDSGVDDGIAGRRDTPVFSAFSAESVEQAARQARHIPVFGGTGILIP